MRTPRPLTAALVVFALAGFPTGCERGQGPPARVEPVTCEFPYPDPSGWAPGQPQLIPEGAFVASQQVFREGKRAIAFSAGVLRDQFETAPLRDRLPLSGGGEAMLFEVEDPAPGGYTLFWYGPEPCKQYAVDGVDGFSSPGDFVGAMREIGVLAPEAPPSP